MNDNDGVGIIICGSRNFNDYALAEDIIDTAIALTGYGNTKKTIISGHCRGADMLGEEYANSNGIDIRVFPADWGKFGKSAGPIRNKQMIECAKGYSNSLVIAFTTPTSSGTHNTIHLAEKNGIPVIVCELERDNQCFSLVEGISVVDDGIVMDFNSNHSNDIIKFKSTFTRFSGNMRFYLCKVNKESDKLKQRYVLNYIKSGADAKIDELLFNAIEDFYAKSDVKHFDHIVVAPSASPINNRIAQIITDEFDDSIIVHPSKKPVQDLDIDWGKLRSQFGGDEAYARKLRVYLTNYIEKLKTDPNFSIHKIMPQYRKFIKPMIVLGDTVIEPHSSILLVDDVFTTGTTIKMMIDALNDSGFAGTITIFTLVNNK